MQEIAQAYVGRKDTLTTAPTTSAHAHPASPLTHSHDFNEIMPTIFRRFMEKEAREWRQIYKVCGRKTGSYRPCSCSSTSSKTAQSASSTRHACTYRRSRSCVTFTMSMKTAKTRALTVRDSAAADAVRTRAKELANLLSDVDMIRAERRKARANRAKYHGTGNDFVPGSGTGRYGGFSSESYYASGGANIRGSSTSAAGMPEYEEYDAGADEEPQASTTEPKAAAPPEPAVADLFSFDDPAPAASAPSKQPADDFDDFQSAEPAPAAPSTAAPSSKTTGGSLFDLLDEPAPQPSRPPLHSASSMPPLQPSPKPAAASLPPMPASSASSPMLKPTSAAPQPTQPTAQASRAPASAPAPKPASSASLFDDLWAESRGKPATSSDTGKKSMAELAKDQTSSSVWGSSKPDTGSPKDLFDLL